MRLNHTNFNLKNNNKKINNNNNNNLTNKKQKIYFKSINKKIKKVQNKWMKKMRKCNKNKY